MALPIISLKHRRLINLKVLSSLPAQPRIAPKQPPFTKLTHAPVDFTPSMNFHPPEGAHEVFGTMHSVLSSYHRQDAIQTSNRSKQVPTANNASRVTLMNARLVSQTHKKGAALTTALNPARCTRRCGHTSSLLLRLVDARSRTSVALRPPCHRYPFADSNISHLRCFAAGGRRHGPEASDAPDARPPEPEPEPKALPAGAPLPPGLRVVGLKRARRRTIQCIALAQPCPLFVLCLAGSAPKEEVQGSSTRQRSQLHCAPRLSAGPLLLQVPQDQDQAVLFAAPMETCHQGHPPQATRVP